MKIGFIGIGQMGRGMAARLLDRGFSVCVWNRTRAAADALASRGASIAENARAALDVQVVITMLADDRAIEDVWIANALVEAMPRDAIHLNMASVSLAMAKRLVSAHEAHGARYVSAPVFGRPEAAARGELDIVAAGAREALAGCVTLFEALGRRWFDLGSDPVHANAVKIARNFMLAAIIESLGEAFALVKKSGIDPARFLEIITSTSMSAPAYRNYGRLMIERPANPTFTLKLGLKDVELALAAAADVGAALPSAVLIRQQHLRAIARGYGDEDWAALGNYIAGASADAEADGKGYAA